MDTREIIGFIQKVAQSALDRTALRILIWLEDKPNTDRIGPPARYPRISLRRFNQAMDADQ